MKIDLVGMIKRAGRVRQGRITVAPILPPSALGADLQRIFMRVVRSWGAELLERGILDVYARTLGEPRMRTDSVDDLEGGMEAVGSALTRLVLSLNANLEDWVVRVEEWHRGRFGQLFSATGVRLDTLLGRGDVSATLQSVLAENTALIRSLNDQMRNGISGAVFRGLTNRTPAADVAREIRKVTAVGRARAELIAADQLQKLTGRLDQERQEQMGIRKFEWAHSRKKNPRQEHKARDGKVYAWNSEVARTDPPGRAIRCGCRARAVVELDDETGAVATTGPAEPKGAATTSPAAAESEARNYVVREGKKTGTEHLVAYDGRTGREVVRLSGSEAHVGFPKELQDELRRKGAQIVLHHNHPNSASFSRADILVLQNPGAKGIWAHGHNGSSFYAERGKKKPTEAAYRRVAGAITSRVEALGRAGLIDSADANALFHHLVSQALHDADFIRYKASLSKETAAALNRRKAALALVGGPAV